MDELRDVYGALVEMAVNPLPPERLANRRCISKIWAEINGRPGDSLTGTASEWVFWEALLEAAPND